MISKTALKAAYDTFHAPLGERKDEPLIESMLFIDAIEAAIEAHEAEKWLPIETCPNEGNFWVYGGEVSINGYFLRPLQRPTIAGYRAGRLVDDYELEDLKPTHWQPLPQPPKEA